jgi:plasmid segregation protein ParM
MCGEENFDLVVGLPISQYKTQKDRLKEKILSYNNNEVIYHSKKMDINIRDVTVYPQGAAVLYDINRTYGKYILCDFGAYTLDVALIEMVNGLPTISQYNTWFKGLSTINSKIIDLANNMFGVTLDDKDAEDILINEHLNVNGESVDISFIDCILDQYIEEVYQLIDLNYKTHTTDIYAFGGSAEIIFDRFKTRYPQAELVHDAQFANANSYYIIGCCKYKGGL